MKEGAGAGGRSRPPATAYNRALDALARRGRSESELRRWLKEREFPPDEIDDAVRRLQAAGLLDDAKYALAFARSRIVGRKLSRRRAQAELTRRGVSREVADAAIAAVLEDEGVDEAAAIEAVAAKKLRGLAKLDAQTQARRLTAFLARRGYDGDAVRAVVRRVLAR